MSNIKVSMRRALEPSRSEYNVSKIMTVQSVVAIANKFQHKLIGNRSKMTKLLVTRYAIGDKLIVSDGEVIGKSKAVENTFFV